MVNQTPNVEKLTNIVVGMALYLLYKEHPEKVKLAFDILDYPVTTA